MPMLARKAPIRFWMILAIAGGEACDGAPSGTPEAVAAQQKPRSESNEAPSGAAADGDPRCNTLFDAHDIPFLAVTFWTSDSCPSQRTGLTVMPSSTITSLTREPGKVCMSGQVTTGYANLILDFDGENRDGIQGSGGRITPEQSQGAKPLDAVGLGITQIQFTLDTPPASGLAVNLASVVLPGCYGRAECLHSGYYLMSEGQPGVLERVRDPGVHGLRIADFQAAPWVDPTEELDTTQLAFVAFELGAGAYDFCIRDLKMLEAKGAVVSERR